ncbi:trypsin-like peptidase domain-containing protein [Planctellipticum variicoloris]|uniref:trypsin-like peptidase domain-containing protein n=1 Tax=Planctellipticum variicoloris TaxID=3064265 RepID=UPI003013D581|nr:trypsin-like peptidase domain-containing protein [Planctomycetaceae bacterium SH412]
MRQRSLIWIASGALAAGTLLGAGLMCLWGESRLQADALDRDAAERAYQDLAGEMGPLQLGSQHLAKIAALTTPSVVHIQSERQSQSRGKIEETGSGVILASTKAEGFYVVTNRHVIDGATLPNITISLNDGREIHPDRVWQDAATDVAVMKISASGVVAAKWGDSNQIEIGNMVLALGSPFGLSRSVTFGIISAKGRRSLRLGAAEVLNQDFLQTDAAINPGNSGGPLIDLQGRVIGINTAIASSGGGNEGIGFSIPCNLAQRVMEQLLEHGAVQRAYLGVRLDPAFDSKTAARLRLDRVQGSRVTEVYPNSPASRTNLQFDDVILTFDGIEIQDENHLINLVSLTAIGKEIRLTVWRGGRKLTLKIVLTDRKEMPQQTSEAPSEPGMGVPIRQMGLTVHPLDGDLAEQLGFERDTQGLLVLKIDQDSPLASDLKLYDLIENIGQMPVKNVADLQFALEQSSSSASVLLKVSRGGRKEPVGQLVVWRR